MFKPTAVTILLSLSYACGSGTGGGADAPPDVPDASPTGCTTTVAPRPGTVITTTGAVTGSAAADGTTYAWKGIPYAAPPTGALRWRPPEPAACWTDERLATAFGPPCPQLDDDGIPIGAEDCLTVNVWAPATAAGAPVLVFLHGGGNTGGTASDPLYDGEALARQTGAVVVTVEYRLGALGFFAHPELDAERVEQVSGNYGILDQIAALTWVKGNIAGFGGAPGQVLVFGESAGAQDTLIHVASPLSRGLFAAAIAESGGSYRSTLADVETAMQELVDAVDCTGAASVVECMRAVPADELAAVPSADGPLSRGMLQYVPAIDGVVLPASVPDLIAAGAHAQVPLVLGTNADETSRMVRTVEDVPAYEDEVRRLYGPAANALLAIYPASEYDSPQQALVRMTTDVTWTCPMRRLARTASENQTAPVYRYFFTWRPPGPIGGLIGATHGIELPFVFRTFSAFGYTPNAADLALADAIDGYWSRLAATGDPDGAGAVPWPRYDAVTDPYLALDLTITAGAGLRTAECDAIDALVGG